MGNSIDIHTLKQHIDQLEIKIATLEKNNTAQSHNTNKLIEHNIDEIDHNSSINNHDEQGYEIPSVTISDGPELSLSIHPIIEYPILNSTTTVLRTIPIRHDNIMDNTDNKKVFECPNCNKSFKYYSRLQKHLDRKTPCNPVITIKDDDRFENAKKERRVCEFCNRKFKSNQTMKIHLKKNCPIAPTGKNGGSGIEILNKHLDSIIPIVVPQLDGITMQVHGNENLSYITEDDVDSIFNSSITKKMINEITRGNQATIDDAINEILRKTLDAVYNNKLHPENYNMFITSNKEFLADKKIMTYKKDGWSLEDCTDVYSSITNTIIHKLIQYKHPMYTTYTPVIDKLIRVKAISEKLLYPVITKVKLLLEEYGLLPYS